MINARIKETDIQYSVCDYLETRGYIFWRQNNLVPYDPINKRFRKMPKYSVKGVSDIIVLVDGTAWFLEIKKLKTYQSPDQKEFERLVKRGGCLYYVIRSIDDLLELGF